MLIDQYEKMREAGIKFSKIGSKDLHLNKLIRKRNKPNFPKCEMLSLKLGSIDIICKAPSRSLIGTLATGDFFDER